MPDVEPDPLLVPEPELEVEPEPEVEGEGEPVVPVDPVDPEDVAEVVGGVPGELGVWLVEVADAGVLAAPWVPVLFCEPECVAGLEADWCALWLVDRPPDEDGVP